MVPAQADIPSNRADDATGVARLMARPPPGAAFSADRGHGVTVAEPSGPDAGDAAVRPLIRTAEEIGELAIMLPAVAELRHGLD